MEIILINGTSLIRVADFFNPLIKPYNYFDRNLSWRSGVCVCVLDLVHSSTRFSFFTLLSQSASTVFRIAWIRQNNARLKLSCKFGESLCDPYWDITLTTSHGMNFVLNDQLTFSQHDPYAIPSEIHICSIMIQVFCKFQESNWNSDWVIGLLN